MLCLLFFMLLNVNENLVRLHFSFLGSYFLPASSFPSSDWQTGLLPGLPF